MERVDNSCCVGVGVSGGADSAAACLLLLESGFKVKGFTMLLGGDCGRTAEKGAAVSARLGIPHEVIDLRDAFERLILQPFVEDYARGRTPSPCVVCNSAFKFGALWDAMANRGCSCMATGHFARVRQVGDGRYGLFRGVDGRKDQSYFLAQLSQEQLSRAVFPLGEHEKSDLRARVQALGLVGSEEHESQDLCFLPDGNFAGYVASRRPGLVREGIIVDQSGRVLGRHHGAFQYTAGQRRGLGLGGGPWFVVRTDTARNEVVVAHAEDMVCRSVSLRGMNWLVEEPPRGAEVRALVQVRYLMAPRSATLVAEAGGRGRMVFDTPIQAASPGQLAVAYDGDRVVASGWIE